MWSIQLLGGLSANDQQRQVSRFRTQKAASLLAYLAFHRASQPRETLIEMLWPETEPEAGRHNLSMALSFLRHQLEPPGVPPGTVILADRFSVQLNPEAVTTDVQQLERLVRQAGQPERSEEERLAQLQQAADLYKGPLLPGYFEEWIGPEALRLESLFVQVVGQLVPLLQQAGQGELTLEYAQRAFSADPLNEEAARQVMQTLSALGQIAQARQVYRAFAQRLAEELNTHPSPALKKLAEQLEANDAFSTSSAQRTAGQSAEEKVSMPVPPLSRRAQPEPSVAAAIPSSAAIARLKGSEFLLRTTTRFFGREAEITRLSEMLASPRTRLVTLMGPGGTGKTRLALEAAARLVENSDGEADSPLSAVFVPLADIFEAGRLFEVILHAMGVVPAAEFAPLDQLVQVLASQPPTLFLLDNFEQLVEEGALLVRELLARADTVKLLVTSRQKLDLQGEREFHLAPLPTSTDEQDPQALLQVAGIALFVDRAQAILPDFQLTERNAAVVSQLCARLEGIPLAIELAAARVGVLSPAHILEQVSVHPLDFLAARRRDTASRQRTLRATLDWSYHLLPPTGQAFLMQLSVFRGGWTLEAAEAVCEVKQGETLQLLMLLRDNSLVDVIDTEEGIRFRMLETIREYAAQQLEKQDERESVAIRHRDYFLRLAEIAEPHLTGSEQVEWFARLEVEYDNLRAALEGSLNSGEREKGKGGRGEERADSSSLKSQVSSLSFAGALGTFWEVRGYLSEGRAYLARALGRESFAGDTAVRAKALNAAGVLANRQGDYEAARALHEESLALFQGLADRRGIAGALLNLGNVAHCQGDYSMARTFYQQSLALSRELDDPRSLATALYHLGNVAMDQGNNEAARRLYEESLALVQQWGDQQSLATLLFQLGNVALDQADNAVATDLYEQSLVLRRALGDRRGSAWSLCNLGYVAHCEGNYATARTRFDAGLATFRELGDKRGIAWALHNLGSVAKKQGDYFLAKALYQQSLTLRQELRDRQGSAWSLYQLGNVARDQGGQEAAGAYLEESLALFRELEDQRGITACLSILGALALDQGDYAEASRLYGQSQAIWEALGDRQGIAWSLHNRGEVARLQGELRAARALHQQSLRLREEVGDQYGIACSLEEFVRLEVAEGEWEQAGRLCGAAHALRIRLGSPLPTQEQEAYERNQAVVRERLGEAAFAAAWSEGQGMLLEQAIAYALEEMPPE